MDLFPPFSSFTLELPLLFLPYVFLVTKKKFTSVNVTRLQSVSGSPNGVSQFPINFLHVHQHWIYSKFFLTELKLVKCCLPPIFHGCLIVWGWALKLQVLIILKCRLDQLLLHADKVLCFSNIITFIRSKTIFLFMLLKKTNNIMNNNHFLIWHSTYKNLHRQLNWTSQEYISYWFLLANNLLTI